MHDITLKAKTFFLNTVVAGKNLMVAKRLLAVKFYNKLGENLFATQLGF